MVWRQIDDYGILLKVNTGEYCEINETGLSVWQQLEQEVSMQELVSRVAVVFGTSEQDVRQDVIDFAKDLAARDMLVMEEGRATDK